MFTRRLYIRYFNKDLFKYVWGVERSTGAEWSTVTVNKLWFSVGLENLGRKFQEYAFTAQKLSFPLSICSVSETKYAKNWKSSFLCNVSWYLFSWNTERYAYLPKACKSKLMKKMKASQKWSFTPILMATIAISTLNFSLDYQIC